MPRRPREFVPGAIYHVYARGSNRQAIFAYDSDKLDFLGCLDRVVSREGIRCLGYCLMSNHYHLVLIAPETGLSAGMKQLNGRYSLRFNQRYGRDAHLFKNRFGAVVQESEPQIFATLRYVARNPIETRLCARPEEWPWSSYRASAGIERAPRFLDVGTLLTYLGDTPDRATARYRELVEGSIGV